MTSGKTDILSNLNSEVQKLIDDDLGGKHGLVSHAGLVENGFDLNAYESIGECPLCKSESDLRYTYVLCELKEGTKLVYSAGSFCSNCPTIMIDETILLAEIENDQYVRVLGIQSDSEASPQMFKKWKGEALKS